MSWAHALKNFLSFPRLQRFADATFLFLSLQGVGMVVERHPDAKL